MRSIDHLQLAARDVVDSRAIMACRRGRQEHLGAQEVRPDSVGCCPSARRDVDGASASRPAAPTDDAPAPIGQRLMLPCSVAPPTESTTRSTPRPSVSRVTSGRSRRSVVDAVVEAQAPSAARAGRRSRRWPAPSRRPAWPAGSPRCPTPPAPAWTSTVSPAFRWPNSNRQSSAVPNGHRDAGPQVEIERRPGAPTCSPRAPRPARRASRPSDVRPPLAHREVGDVRADLAHRAGALVADDVRAARQLAAGTVAACRRPRC